MILVLFGVAIYIFNVRHAKSEFSERLKQRVEITENFFLEKTSFSEREFEKIRDQFLHTLPRETEEVIELGQSSHPEFINEYPKELQEDLVRSQSFSFELKEAQGESKIFRTHGKNYLIIVTAVDEIGMQNLSFLFNRMIVLILFGIPIIFAVCFIITKRALHPLSKKIRHANKIGVKNLDERLNVINPKDEIGQMAIAFNKLLDRLEKSFEAQRAFIANASHEIRNPLTAIMGEAEVTSNKDRSPEEYKESLGIILQEGERLNLTVNNLLQLSKVISNEEVIQFETINFIEFLKQVIQSYSFLNPKNQLKLKVPLKRDKGAFLYGNVNLLKTALINIFDNACKFSENKEVKVSMSSEDEFFRLIIEDKGIGIPSQELEKISEPFFRGSNTLRLKGSGIGLSLTAKIVELHKGELNIESELDKGTRISIKFPYFAD
jgi:signal transduction histidine kinase